MALLQITEKDIKLATPPEAGWHLFEITEFEATDRSKKTPPKNDFEYRFIVSVVKSSPDAKEDNVGRQLPLFFYSSGMPFMLPFIGAVLDQPVKAAMTFDPDEFVAARKQFMGEVIKGMWNNKPTLKIENFSPASACPF